MILIVLLVSLLLTALTVTLTETHAVINNIVITTVPVYTILISYWESITMLIKLLITRVKIVTKKFGNVSYLPYLCTVIDWGLHLSPLTGTKTGS